MKLTDDISQVGLNDANMYPDPDKGIGRKCYALSEIEDQSVELLENRAKELFRFYSNKQGKDYVINGDAFGNLFITYFGEDRDGPTIMSGSHVDSVKDGGKYDGVLGIENAFNFLEKLVRNAHRTHKKAKKNFTVAIFVAEESSPKTGVACLGSSIATGQISKEKLESISYKLDDGNEVLLKDYFEGKYGEGTWEAVLNELDNPVITKEKVALFEELHIEQSRVIQDTRKQLGIVIDGIGGARRETYHLDPEYMNSRKIHVNEENPICFFKIDITGEEAHTGGTPPNPTPVRTENKNWYRKDALVASSVLLQNLLESTLDFEVRKMGVPEKTGFTTVPAHQFIQFAVPELKAKKFSSILNKWARGMANKNGVQFSITETHISKGKKDGKDKEYAVLDKDMLSQLLTVPTFVESSARGFVNRDGGFGKVRATITDMIIDPETGVDFNMDVRDVNTVRKDELVERLDDMIKILLHEQAVNQVLSDATYAPISELLVKTKKRIADTLALSYVEMPSMPGHDAGKLSKLGVPTSMTYVKHDGISHNPHEKVNQEDYENAQKVSHAFLAEMVEAEFSGNLA